MAFWDEVEPGWTPGQVYDTPRTDETVTSDIATVRQDVDNSGTGSQWGGFGQAVNRVLDYTLQRDAVRTNAQLQAQRAQTLGMQPVVSRNGGSVAVNPSGLLLIGGVVLGVYLLAHKG